MKRCRLEFAAAFRIDLEDHIDWLSDRQRAATIDLLRAELEKAFDLLETFPSAGVVETPPLRKLLLHRLPFVIWYVIDEKASGIQFLRLFHARQHRPTKAAKPRRRR